MDVCQWETTRSTPVNPQAWMMEATGKTAYFEGCGFSGLGIVLDDIDVDSEN